MDMVRPEVSMKRMHQWYVVADPDTGDHTNWDWCRDTFGEPDMGTGRWHYDSSNLSYWFRNERDAMWFTIRYSDEAARNSS